MRAQLCKNHYILYHHPSCSIDLNFTLKSRLEAGYVNKPLWAKQFFEHVFTWLEKASSRYFPLKCDMNFHRELLSNFIWVFWLRKKVCCAHQKKGTIFWHSFVATQHLSRSNVKKSILRLGWCFLLFFTGNRHSE